MKIKRIRLKNFRTYKELDLSLSGNLVFFTGPNGIGKTSILEAISLASILKSFRGGIEKNIIKFEADYFNVEVTVEDEAAEPVTLHIGYGRHPESKSNAQARSLSINKNKVDRLSDFIGKFPTVVFSPDDIDIIDTNPNERRRFIDMILSSLYSSYLEALQKYRRTLRMRSELFKKIYGRPLNENRAYIASIDKELAQAGYFIQQKRSEFIADFQNTFDEYVKLISNGKDSWQIIYRPSSNTTDQAGYQAALDKALVSDLKLRQTSVGIHRDRIQFIPKNTETSLDLMQIASQGQKRTVALALKMAQFTYTRKLIKTTPILLIDDVLNELDIERRKSFILFLNDIGQALITTTDLAGIENYVRENRANFTIEAFELKSSETGVKLQLIDL